MLVLTRKQGEEVVIRWGDSFTGEVYEIVVSVAKIEVGERDNHKVRLGIDAPDWVEIDRREIRDAKDRQ